MSRTAMIVSVLWLQVVLVMVPTCRATWKYAEDITSLPLEEAMGRTEVRHGPGAAPSGPGAQTFGMTLETWDNETSAVVVGEHVLSPNATSGVASFFWMTSAPALPYITVIYDIDGEYSIEFQLFDGHGIGFGDETMWGRTRMGKGSVMSGVYNTYQIPFYKSLRVSIEVPFGNGPTELYANVRGTENVPVTLGHFELPSDARLFLYRNVNASMRPLEFIELFETHRAGAVLGIYISVLTKPPINFWEGCFRVYDPANKTAVKWWLSTGTEDFFQSGWGFSCVWNCREYWYPEAGFTHTDGETMFAAYKLFEQDHLFFDQRGATVMWRLGETFDATGMKCHGWGDPNGQIVGGVVTPAVVTTYAWVYEW